MIWSSAQFGFVRLSDKFTTGSSIMPQKRNPDAAELVRAKVGRIIGALTSLMVVMKGLPLAYSKDMQEDKEVAFDALDSSVAVARRDDRHGRRPRRSIARRCAAAADAGFSTATDVADWLVREANMPFRDAHHITGQHRRAGRSRRASHSTGSPSRTSSRSTTASTAASTRCSVENSVASRKSYGGTAPDNVLAQAARWKETLTGEKTAPVKRKPAVTATATAGSSSARRIDRPAGCRHPALAFCHG